MRFSIVSAAAAIILGLLPKIVMAQDTRSVLLESEGVLEAGDETLIDGSLYDIYRFEGAAGQGIIVTVESEEFDPYLWLLAGEGPTARQVGDWQGSTTSALSYVLPEDGIYRIWVNANTPQGRGQYRLLVEATADDDPIALKPRADALLEKGNEQYRFSQFREASNSWQQALELYQRLENRRQEASILNNLGVVYRDLGDSERAIDMYEQAIVVAREIVDPTAEARTLFNLGLVYEDLWNNGRAIEAYEDSLSVARLLGDRAGESRALEKLGAAYSDTGNYQRAIEVYEQSLAVARELGDRAGEVSPLGHLGVAYSNLGSYQRAIDLYEQTLAITRELGDRAREGTVLTNLGVVYENLSQYERAIELHEQSLVIVRELGDRAREGRALNNLGNVYVYLDQYERAIDLYERSLAIDREWGDSSGESKTLGNLGNAYLRLGDYERAINLYEQSLVIERETGDRAGESRTLGNLSLVYRNLGQYQRAIELHEQGLAIVREIGDRAGEGFTLNNLGLVYRDLGQYQRAMSLYEQSLTIQREIGDRTGEAATLGNLGLVYRFFGQYKRAIELFEKQAVIAREIGYRSGEGGALGSLGLVYRDLGQYERAIDLSEQYLAIMREIGHRVGEGVALDSLGDYYLDLGQYDRTIKLYEQWLLITRELGDRSDEGRALGDFGFLFEVQDQPGLAVAFYKASLNLQNSVSQELSDPLARQSYLETVAGYYNALTQLLLSQNRQLEAQQVIERFKRQELSDYANEDQLLEALPPLTLLPEEQAVLNAHDRLLASKQSPQAQASYQQSVDQLEGFIQASGYDGHPLLTDNFFLAQAKAVVAQQPGTVLIYPIVLPDSLWLLWVDETGIASSHVTDANDEALTATIQRFRAGLESRYSDIADLQAAAQQLYRWLIEPVELSLGETNPPQHLVLALDRSTRYIPVAALHDGQQYLVEKYNLSTILAATLTDATARTPIGETASVVAAGVSQRFEGFSALPNVPIELDAIVKDSRNRDDRLGVYPGRQLLDQAFTASNLKSSLTQDTRFLHIATHGEFVAGNRYASYLLLGNGERLPLPDIAQLGEALRGVHLAVLSACQTALGGRDEEGLEIAGLGYYFFKNEVDAVMASLWNVNDSSTSQLMQAFYTQLSKGTENQPVTKAEALRAAQLAMLSSNEPVAAGEDRFTFRPQNDSDARRPQSGLAHPYYWAPFVLIGNGL